MKEREAFSAGLFSTVMKLSSGPGSGSTIVSPCSDYFNARVERSEEADEMYDRFRFVSIVFCVLVCEYLVGWAY